MGFYLFSWQCVSGNKVNCSWFLPCCPWLSDYYMQYLYNFLPADSESNNVKAGLCNPLLYAHSSAMIAQERELLLSRDAGIRRPFWRVLSARLEPCKYQSSNCPLRREGQNPWEAHLPPTPGTGPVPTVPGCSLPRADIRSIHLTACVGFLIILNHISQNSFWHAVLNTDAHKDSARRMWLHSPPPACDKKTLKRKEESAQGKLQKTWGLRS